MQHRRRPKHRGHKGGIGVFSGGLDRKRPKAFGVFLLLLAGFLPSVRAQSVCFGSTGAGRLQGGVMLPSHGENFVSYGSAPVLAGRTYVHSKVREVMVEAYAKLASQLPAKVFKYGETGFREGGRFKPHKTHQNGLSVDFMVPVLDNKGRSVVLPTNPFNKYGYGIEFDHAGRWREYRIDYEALAAHLLALQGAAKQHGIAVRRVLFDPELQPLLFATKYGTALKSQLRFAHKRSWVRHDDHYHVDFSVPCKPL